MTTLDIETIPTTTSEETPSETEQKTGTMDETNKETKGDRTLALIKPDAMQANHKDEIISKIKENGFTIVQEQQLLLSKETAGLFYKEHEGKSFYQDLTHWMSSAPIYALILEKQDAVPSWRNLMGPTDSSKAREVEPNSIRALFGTDGSQNATHGSDNQASAEREIALIFGQEVVQVEGSMDQGETHDVCNKPDTTDVVVVDGHVAMDHDEETTVTSQLLENTLSEKQEAETKTLVLNQVVVSLDATLQDDVSQSDVVADLAAETTVLPEHIKQVDTTENIPISKPEKKVSETAETAIYLEQEPIAMVDEVKSNVVDDDEPEAGAAATPDHQQQEPAVVIDRVTEAKDSLDHVVTEAEPVVIAVTVEEAIIDADNVDEQKKQDEPVSAASVMMTDINDVAAVTAVATIEVVTAQDDEKTPTVTVIDIVSKQDDDVRLKESVTQEKEPEEDDPNSITTSSNNNNSASGGSSISHSSGSQSSKNSSVTEKNQVKEKIKETHVNKKQPKLKTPGSGGGGAASSAGIRRPAGSTVVAAAVTATDKKKVATSTGLRKPTTSTLKKPITTDEEKPKTKTKAPSRVALLSQPKKKPVQPEDGAAAAAAASVTAATAADIKTKKATAGNISLVSRLTESTAASARKKLSSADATTSSTNKPADAVRPKKISTSSIQKTPRATASTAATTGTTGTRASKAPPTTTTTTTTKPSIPISAGAKKPTTTEGGTTRRTLPPTSTLATKKVDGNAKRTTTGTRATTASGLPSATNTRKETLSIGSKLKKPAPTTKAAANKKSATAVSKVTKADTTALSVSSISSTADHTSSSSPSSASSSSSSSSGNQLVSTKNDDEEKGPEQVPDNDNSGALIQETDTIVESFDNEQDSRPIEKMDNNEQQVESVEIAIQQHHDDVIFVEPSTSAAVNTELDDAEVAAILTTTTTTTTTTTAQVETKKPQMASLRSRFENLNANGTTNNTSNPVHHHQLHTTPSKEIRSKSPNRISNMIHAFNK